ncbi:metallophosphoesterase [Pseudoxanthomonas sp.]|uniref:metallophosphoesterase n=1 Tax=Pseudoxanthomonas sp. TaxID=1871049 RepID=UPI0025898C8C|nr:metallophosphoesterase [Pseudoxanthomonas sp.]MCR6687080.1 metallophosphoesterase [Pseudoxanthomonas sp.]
MRLLILSDLHREVWYPPGKTYWEGWVDQFPVIDLSVSRPDAVVLAGDIDVGTSAVAWADETFPGLPVLYVTGNHEGYGENLDDVQRKLDVLCRATGHIHYLNRREVWIEGVRFLGAMLWTDFMLYGRELYPAVICDVGTRMNDYRRIRLASQGYRKLKPSDTKQWHFADRTWLTERLSEPFDGPTVVITHMAPSEQSVPEEYRGDIISAAFASHLDHLVEQADLWIHGHTHTSFDYRIGRGQVVCNPLGYPRGRDGPPENAAFDPNLVVEI